MENYEGNAKEFHEIVCESHYDDVFFSRYVILCIYVFVTQTYGRMKQVDTLSRGLYH